MISDKVYRRIAYIIITIGVVLSLWIAVVPHFDAGHRLDVYLLLLGLLPYFIYGVLTAVLHRWALLIPGLLTLAVDLLLRLPERLQTADPVDGDWSCDFQPSHTAGGIIYCMAIGSRTVHGRLDQSSSRVKWSNE